MTSNDSPLPDFVDRTACIRQMGSTHQLYFSRQLFDTCVRTRDAKDGSNLDSAILGKTITSIDSGAPLPTFLSICGFPFYVANAPHCDQTPRIHVMLPREAPRDTDTLARSYLINLVFRELRYGDSRNESSHRVFLSRRLKYRCKRVPLAADGTTIERQLYMLAFLVREKCKPLEWRSINGVSLCSYHEVDKDNVIHTYYMLEQEGPPEPVNDGIPF